MCIWSNKHNQLRVKNFSSPAAPLKAPHLQLGLGAFLWFAPDIHRTFPGSEDLAHRWGNYTRRFVVLIDLVEQFLRGRKLCGPDVSALLVVRCGPPRCLLTFRKPVRAHVSWEECNGFPCDFSPNRNRPPRLLPAMSDVPVTALRVVGKIRFQWAITEPAAPLFCG